MWRISRACCSRHFLSLNGCLYLASRRSKSLNAFAEKVLSDSLTFRHRASKLSRGSSLPWFLYDEGGMSVPIFIKRPNNVNSAHVPDITDHFGLLSFSQPSTSGESPYSLDENVTFIPTVLDDSAEESRLVNSPQAGSEDSTATIGNDCENMNISKILEQFREEVRDGLSDSGANLFESRILDEEITQQAHRYILPNFRRHKFLRKLLPHRDYLLIRRSKYAKNCRLRSSNHQHVVPKVTERLHASSVVASSQSNARNILLSSAEMNSPMSEQASQRASSPNINQSSAPRSEESEKSEESERNVNQKEGPGQASVSRIMFDPLEVRVEEVSAAQLRKLTKQKDIENLRMMLNEHHWPHFETIKEFISELFEVFIVKGVNCDEVKRLMWDFAATNNRAYVRDVVVVSLLERIVREEGIEAAISYARLNRDMFLVKAPIERRSKKSLQMLTEKLFATVFEFSSSAADSSADQVKQAKKLQDILVELGYVNDCSAFLLASVSSHLKMKAYTAAQQQWSWNALNYRSILGAHLLLRATLQDERISRNVQQQRIGKILTICEQYKHPFAGIAELIVELCNANKAADVKLLLTKLSIPGNYFRDPLNRMVKDGMTEENSISLANIEKFATHVSECMHPVRRKRSPKITEQPDQNDCVEKQQMHDTESGDSVRHIGDGGDDGYSKSIGEFIANRMFSAKRHKNRSAWKRKTKKHKADVEQLHVLALIVQKCWVDLAVARNDKASLSRLWEWSVQNKLEANLLESRRLKNIFATKIGRATSKE